MSIIHAWARWLAAHYAWLVGRPAPLAPAIWQVAQPDYEALCHLCQTPVTVCPHIGPLAFLETCMECGVVIDRAYTGPHSEGESLCVRCRTEEQDVEGEPTTANDLR